MIEIGTFTITQSQKKKGYLLPNAPGCIAELDSYPDTGEANYEDVDDPVLNPDDDATYVSSEVTDSAKYDMYNLSAWTGNTTGTINDITVYSRGKGDGFVPPNAKYYLLLLPDSDPCANYFESDDKDVTSSYKVFSNSWRENPSSATDWTWEDLDDLQIGVKLQSSEFNYSIVRTINTVGAGYATEWTPMPIGCQCDGSNWKHINPNYHACGYPEEICYIYAQKYAADPPEYFYDAYIFEDVSGIAPSGSVARVTISIKAQWYVGEINPCDRPPFNGFIRIGGVNYYTDDLLLEHGQHAYKWFSHSWVLNPSTGLDWEWADLAALEAGIRVHFSCTDALVYCHVREVNINVQYNVQSTVPKICCTQTYAEVNYSEAIECTLNKPEEIGIDHNRNIQMLNFWDGSREVYDLERTGKTMVLMGKECDTANSCEHITCIRNMGKEGSTIAISGLSDLYNGNYKIRSFGWNHISEKPEIYEWILELEDEA